MGRISLWVLGAGLLCAAGCDDGGGGPKDAGTSAEPEPAEVRDWTFFVYGHGDHNLSNSLVRDIAEMAEAQLSGNVHVVVLADFDATQTIVGTNEAFPTGAHWLQIEGGGAEPAAISEDEEQNFDDPKVLSAAVAEAFTRFPSKHRALVLWDHGGAWNGGFGGDTQDGTAREISPMAAGTVAQAIRDGLASAAIKEPLDVFAFDTCLMAGTEVISEFIDVARVYIANAEIDYGDGWDYTGFLSHLSAHASDDALKLAQAEVSLWDAHHVAVSSNDTLLRSHVAIDLKRYEVFEKAYAQFVDTLLSSEVVSGIELGRASYFSLPPYMNQLENPGDTPALRDAGLFLARLSQESSDSALKAKAKAAQDALDAAILGKSQGTIRESAGQHGIHIELPLASAMTEEHLAAYARLAPTFSKVSRWDQALRAYGALNDGVAPTITASIANDVDPDATRLPTVTFSSADTDLAEALVEVALFTQPDAPDELLFFGVTAKGSIAADTEYAVSWDGQLTALPDGQDGLQPVYVRVWEDVGSDVATGQSIAPLLATFGLVNTADGTEALGALLFQDGDDTTGLLVIFDPAITLPLGDVAQDLPGTTFTPILFAISISTLEESAQLGLPIALDSPSLPVSRGAASPGAYALLTSLTDVFGNVGVDIQSVLLSTPISLP